MALHVQSSNQCCEIYQPAITKNLRTQFKGWFETSLEVYLKKSFEGVPILHQLKTRLTPVFRAHSFVTLH